MVTRYGNVPGRLPDKAMSMVACDLVVLDGQVQSNRWVLHDSHAFAADPKDWTLPTSDSSMHGHVTRQDGSRQVAFDDGCSTAHSNQWVVRTFHAMSSLAVSDCQVTTMSTPLILAACALPCHYRLHDDRAVHVALNTVKSCTHAGIAQI